MFDLVKLVVLGSVTEFVRQDRIEGGKRIKLLVDDQITVLLFALWRCASDTPCVCFAEAFDRDFSVFWNSALKHDVVQNLSPSLAIRN